MDCLIRIFLLTICAFALSASVHIQTISSAEDDEVNDNTLNVLDAMMTAKSIAQTNNQQRSLRQRRTIIFRPLLQYKEEEIIKKGHYKPSALGQYGVVIPIQAASNAILTTYGDGDYNNQYDFGFQ